MQIVELKVNVEKSQLEALAAEVEKLNGKVINFKTSTGGTGGASPTDGLNKGLKETQQQAEKTGQSIFSVMGKVARWTSVTTAVYAPVKAFKEALGTLKEVDSQLVQVQKVTNFSQRQMKEIEQQAYKTASAYGVSADKYTESVAAFARAGYKEQSAGLAELSTKTQLVGDTTAEVANQFLLSTDAAYKYNGSVQQLSRVLDGANQLDNNYATSIEKIAEGMGLVAPVAAQAGIGVDELMASLGTITAVTQRSGAEAARAYRALVLNILGDTKTEIADGATWTAGEIEGLRDVLKTYAPEAVKAAEATGDIINPMKAMEGLSQAMKDGVLTEQKLMEMVSDIGGKLRTSQLLALIQNWDMYESMLSDFQNAAGSADKEVENAMNSWERKTEVLKNTWTEFVSHMVDTDLIKGGLDGVTKIVEVLDSDFGQAAIKVAAVTAAFSGLSKAVGAIASSKAIGLIKDIPVFLAAFGDIAKGQGLIAALGQVFGMIGPIGIAIAAIAAAVGTMKLADFLTIDYSEQVEKVKDLKNEYDELYGAQSEYQQLVDKQESGASLDDWEQRRLDYLKDYQKELRNRIELEKELAKEKYQQEYGNQRHVNEPLDDRPTGKRMEQKIETQDVAMAKNLSKAFKELNSEFESGAKGESEYKASIKELMDQYEDFVSLTREGLDEGWLDYSGLTDAQKQILDLYDALERLYSMDGKELRIEAALDSFEQAGDGVAQFANQVVVDGAKMRQAFMDAGLSAEDANRTIQELRDGGAIVIDVENDGLDETLGYLEELGVAIKDGDNWTINVDGLAKLSNELGLSSDEAAALSAALQNAGNVNMDGAVGSVNKIASSVDELISGSPFSLDLVAKDNASGPTATAQENVDNLAATEVNVPLNADDGVSPKAAAARGAIASIPTSHSTKFTGDTSALASAVARAKALVASVSGALSSALGRATGDIHFRGGPVLLGDEISPDGSPRPELVITKTGKAFIAGMSGPVMTNLPAGSRIFKYSDTMDVMSGNDMTQVQAFAGGNGVLGMSLSGIAARGKSGGSSGPSSSTGSSASSSSGKSSSGRSSSSSSAKSGSSSSKGGSTRKSGSKSSGKSSSSSSGSDNDEYLESLKDQLSLLEAQYSFLEASNAESMALVGKSKEIQSQLHIINDYLRQTGGDEKEIVDNSTKWWQELEKQNKVYEDKLSLLKAEYEFLEASGAGTDALIAKSQEIQEQLHLINENLRQTNGTQEDILGNSTEWWKVLKDIQNLKKQEFEDERDLLETESELMEHQGKSAGERIAKLRQIQDNLHREAEYMRSIKDSQADINRLSIQWWQTQEEILKIQQELLDELDEAINAKLKEARKQRDGELALLDRELERLREQRDVQKEQVDLEERRKRIEEARFALENAQRERTVRYYNSKTGQWERGADAKSVEAARKNLEEALKEDKESEEDQAYNLAVKAIEAQKAEVSARYDALELRWETLYESFQEPLRDIEDILADLLDVGRLTEGQVNTVREFAGNIETYTAQILRGLTFTQFQEQTSGSGIKAYMQYLTGDGRFDQALENSASAKWIEEHPGAEVILVDENGNHYNLATGEVTPGKPLTGMTVAEATTSSVATASARNASGSSGSKSTAQVIAEMKENSAKYNSATTAEEKAALANANLAKGTAQGWTRGSDGVWRDKNGNRVYDSGGILSGLGGIKATSGDEIVIPPNIANFMLRPSADAKFRARMAELGYLYGGTETPPPGIAVQGARGNSNDHYGDVYQYGNISLTEKQAKSMTVYDLAQKARNLRVYSAQ